MWFDINDYADFDWEQAEWYADPDSEVWYYGESDDHVNWVVGPGDDCQYRVTMYKPGYGYNGKWDDWGPDYDEPSMTEEFDDLDELSEFIGTYGSVDW